ncbi:Hint domain-containing protein [Roseicyclus mahoneyensis]|uniref:Hint domain-containing protein n=1 Tax=Roseicyclus mahoneyensis TaxID=164332 RepID=A0A316GKW2_9RHOB|nr:Hint domain-containing protein [Roseicyclus mahoneyensis]PWK60648.1 Hint domain-containing protein [Roseicyclus mahoneyensis]
MPVTTNVLGGGIAFNEWHAISFTRDFNGDGIGSGSRDGYFEFINVSANPIDIGGYELWVANSSATAMVLAHTVPVGTILAPSATYTIVSAQPGGGGSLTNVVGQGAIADVEFLQLTSVNTFLVDPANNFIVLTESGGEAFLTDDILSASLNPANLQGQDIVDLPAAESSVGRFPDGEADSWQNTQGPTPGEPNCFLAGTRIATPDGHVAVEDLRVGDTILSADGASVAVLWVGRQTVATRFAPADRLMPVCISAGALGDGLPLRDLRLTADHALMIDGVLVNAGALVNGTTIRPVPLDELGGSYTVYHIETEAHQVILAEAVPAETYIDYVGRQAFDNYGEYLALYGADRAIAEMGVPRITSARQLPPALRARLARDIAA